MGCLGGGRLGNAQSRRRRRALSGRSLLSQWERGSSRAPWLPPPAGGKELRPCDWLRGPPRGVELGGAGTSRADRLLLESTSVQEKVSWLSVRSRFGAGLALFASLSPARFFPARQPKSASSQLMQSRASPGWGCSRRGMSFITDRCSQASCSRDPSGRSICPTSYLSFGARLCMGLNTPLASVEADFGIGCRFHALSIHICIESVSCQTPE